MAALNRSQASELGRISRSARIASWVRSITASRTKAEVVIPRSAAACSTCDFCSPGIRILIGVRKGIGM